MTAQDEIDLIDQAIDENRRVLLQRIHFAPATAAEYQAAWDRNPTLWTRERELFRKRGEAQYRRNDEQHKAWVAEKRRNRFKCAA